MNGEFNQPKCWFNHHERIGFYGSCHPNSQQPFLGWKPVFHPPVFGEVATPISLCFLCQGSAEASNAPSLKTARAASASTAPSCTKNTCSPALDQVKCVYPDDTTFFNMVCHGMPRRHLSTVQNPSWWFFLGVFCILPMAIHGPYLPNILGILWEFYAILWIL